MRRGSHRFDLFLSDKSILYNKIDKKKYRKTAATISLIHICADASRQNGD